MARFTTTGGSGDGTPGTPGADGTNGADGEDGAGFGIFYLGNYNSSSGYVPDIAVVRGSDGQLYLAKASGQLNDPVGNTAQWEVWIPKGANGTNGTNGTDALWNYVGAYSGGDAYAVGDVVTYDGQLWYRFNSNGGNVGDTPSPGLWNLLAAKGADGSGADTGSVTFMGVYVIGDGAESGDGLGNGTLKLMPDADLNSDQYLIIDPTSPNHIHIRAGGVQDASTADLFVGGERTGIQVSDNSDSVTIRSKNADVEGLEENINTVSNTTMIVGFGTDGVTGATVGQLNIGDYLLGDYRNEDAKYTINSAIENSTQGEYTAISEAGNLYYFQAGMPYTIYRTMGEDRWIFQTNGITFPDNTVQSTAFVGGATGTFISQDNKTVTVQNGIITSIV